MGKKLHDQKIPELVEALKKSWLDAIQISIITNIKKSYVYTFMVGISLDYPVVCENHKYKIMTSKDYDDYEEAHRNRKYLKQLSSFEWEE